MSTWEEHLESLREARRKAADRVRSILTQLEDAERDFANATQKIEALVSEAKNASREGAENVGKRQP